MKPGTKTISGWTKGGDFVESIKLTKDDLTAVILPLGARLVDLQWKGVSMVISQESLKEVEEDEMYAGATIGRICNRIKNAKYGDVQVDANSGAHQLHGGRLGWDKRLWNVTEKSETKVVLEYASVDREQGFPSRVETQVVYEVKEDCALEVAMSSKNTGSVDTVVNMTLHPYFDLSGQNGKGEGTILDYIVHAPNCGSMLELDKDGVPTGKIMKTEGTRYDITKPVTFDTTRKIDNYFIDDESDEDMREMVRVTASNVGVLVVETDQPGFQIYTPDGFGSVAIEPSGYVDAPNHKDFPSVELKPGCGKTQRMSFRFE